VLTLESLILIDLRSKRAVTDLPEGFVYTIVPHIVSVKKPKYIGGNGRGRDIDVDDGGSVNLAVISGSVE
jgi:hypothetical protein